MRACVVSLVIVGALAACSGDSPVSVYAQVVLTQHEAKWQQRDFHSYTFDFVQQQLGGMENVHVTVHADSVTSVIDNDTGLPPAVLIMGAPTIDELFVEASHSITNKDVIVGLEFNDQLGYPTLYTVRAKLNTPAGPYSAAISNLTPIE